jgi:hypothetical protein
VSASPPGPATERRRQKTKTSIDLESVRRKDLKRPWTGSPADLPKSHGGENDPRYPSPKQLLRVLSFIIDILAHTTLGLGLSYLILRTATGKPDIGPLIVGTVIFFVGISFVDRVFVQWIFRVTIGKALTGLRVIRSDTGGRANLWHFLRDWLLGCLGILAVFVN